MTLGLHYLLCATGLRLLRSLRCCGQASFSRSTTYARSMSYDVVLVLHASNTHLLFPLRTSFQADSGIELTPLGTVTELVASPRSTTGFHASINIPLLWRVRLTSRQPAGHPRAAQMCMLVTQRTPRVTRGLRSLILTADNLSVG
jgi:hypothetical protein